MLNFKRLGKNARNVGVAPTTAQPPIGHNGGPDMLAELIHQALGPKRPTPVEPFQCGAPWTNHADEDELVRLSVLQGRITRREDALKALKKERQAIMNRCIRRMRRSAGKA